MQETIHLIACEDHKEWLERLQNHISDIVQANVYAVVVSLYSVIYDVNPEMSMWGNGLARRNV